MRRRVAVLMGGRSSEHEVSLASAQAVIAALEQTGAGQVFVHVDLDVLDPSALAGLSYPMPFGVDTTALVALLRAIAARFPLAGAAIAGRTRATGPPS